MTAIRPANRRAFSSAECQAVKVWLAESPEAICPCCGDPLAHVELGRVLVPGSIGFGFAARLAEGIERVVRRPLLVVVSVAG